MIHLTRGDIRDHRPDFNQVMLDLRGEHQVGIPLAQVNSLAIIYGVTRPTVIRE